MRSIPKAPVCLLAALAALPWAPATRAAAFSPDPIIDAPMYPPPGPLMSEPVDVFPKRLVELWRMGLERPSAEDRRQTIDSIIEGQIAGMPGLSELAHPLESVLDEKEQETSIRIDAARALIRINDQAAAPRILAHNVSDGQDMILATDAGLGQWHFAPATEVWRKRLDDPAAGPQVRASAVRALGLSKDVASTPRLMAMAADHAEDLSVRLEAGRSLAMIGADGLENAAKALLHEGDTATGPGAGERLVAVSMLTRIQSQAGQQILLGLAVDPEPSVAAAALTRLLEIDTKLVEPLAPQLLKSPDSTVRRLACQSLMARPTPGDILTIAGVMDDPIPALRHSVRDFLIKTGTDSANDAALAAAVRQGTLEILAGEHWRGLEQAAFVTGKLGYKSAADRLLVLMDFKRAEVRLASFVALRWLNIPETYPTLFKQAQKRIAEFDALLKLAMSAAKNPSVPPPHFAPGEHNEDEEIVQIFEMLGLARYPDLEPICRQWLPKPAARTAPAGSRIAAFWVIGRLFTNKPDPDLIKILIERTKDDNELTGEPAEIRVMAIRAMGMMGAREALLKLKKDKPDNAAIIDLALNPDAPQPPLPPQGQRVRIIGFLEPLPN